MKLKPNVKLIGIRPEILIIIPIIKSVYNQYNKELVITSVSGNIHGLGSYHYIGQAIDCRTRYFEKDTLIQVVSQIESKLTNDFDVILEPDHLHIEYDPETN